MRHKPITLPLPVICFRLFTCAIFLSSCFKYQIENNVVVEFDTCTKFFNVYEISYKGHDGIIVPAPLGVSNDADPISQLSMVRQFRQAEAVASIR